MEEEFYFKCEMCGESFPADPNTMLECSANFRAIDPSTGEIVELDEDTVKEIMNEAKDDPELSPFLKGAICVCLKCQEKFAGEAQPPTSDDF